MGKKLRSRKKIREKNTKKLFACLLSLAMLPANGVTAFASERRSGQKASAVTQVATKAKTAKSVNAEDIKLEEDSLNLKLGCIKTYRLQGIDSEDVYDIWFEGDDYGDKLQIYGTYAYGDQWAYCIIPRQTGEVTVTPHIMTYSEDELTLDPVTFRISANDEDIVPITDINLFESVKAELHLYDEDITSIKKEQMKDITTLNLSGANDINGIQYAINCETLEINYSYGLSDISKLGYLKKLKKLTLTNTKVSNISVLKDLKNLEYINLEGSQVSAEDRFSLIDTTKQTTIEEGRETADLVYPRGGLVQSTDTVTSSDPSVVSVSLHQDSDGMSRWYYKAENGKVGQKATITIENEGQKKEIPVTVVAKKEEIPAFKTAAFKGNMSCYPKIAMGDTSKVSDVNVTSSDTDTLELESYWEYIENGEEMKTYRYNPRQKGTATLTAIITMKDGTRYRDTQKVTIEETPENVVPIKSYNVFWSLNSDDGDYVTWEQLKQMKSLSLSNGNITNEDISWISKAENCKRLELRNNEQLSDIKGLEKLTNVEILDLSETMINDTDTLSSMKAHLKYLNIEDTEIKDQARLDLISSEPINLCEGSKTDQTILPKGLLSKDDTVEIEDSEIADVDVKEEYDDDLNIDLRNVIISAKKGMANKKTKLKITSSSGEIKTIDVNVTEKDKNAPGFANETMDASIGKFSEIKMKNTGGAKVITEPESNEKNVVNVQKEESYKNGEEVTYYYLEPKSEGTANITVEYKMNGMTYEDTMKVTVGTDDTIIPIKDYNLYREMIRNWNSAQRKDHILKSESDKIVEINGAYSGITDLSGIEYATECEKVNFSYCKQLKDISKLNKLTKLKSVNLSNTKVSDISVLKNVKDQLTTLNLKGSKVSVEDRFAFIKTSQEITVKAGTEKQITIKPSGILQSGDACSIEGDDTITAQYTGGKVQINATKVSEEKTVNLVLSKGETKVKLPVQIVEDTSRKPSFTKESYDLEIGNFAKVPMKNTSDVRDITFTISSDDKKIVKVQTANYDGEYHFVPRNKGHATIEAKFIKKDGTIYTDTTSVTVKNADESSNIIPLRSLDTYDMLCDSNNFETNGMITKDQMKQVKTVRVNLDGEDNIEDWLAGLDQATSCEEFFVEAYDVSFKEIKPLLEKFKNIKYMDIAIGDMSQEEFDELFKDDDRIKNLETLYIYSLENKVKDYSAFNYLKNLKDLNLSKDNLTNLECISDLTNLESLSLQYSNLKELKGLEKLTNLKELYLREAEGVKDFSLLAKLTNLEQLALTETNISDVTPLKQLTNLKKINLDDTNVSIEDRVSLIRTNEIVLEEKEIADSVGNHAFISPQGIIQYKDEVSLEPSVPGITCYKEDDYSNVTLSAKAGSAGTKTNLVIKRNGVTYKSIPVRVVKEEATDTPGFKTDTVKTTIGAFDEIPLKNVDVVDSEKGSYSISPADDESYDILEMTYADNAYHFVPKKTGTAKLKGYFTAKNGKTYHRELTVEVSDAPKDIVPITNFKIYEALIDQNGKSVDGSITGKKDYRIDQDEMKKVAKIQGYYCGIKDSDLEYLKQATNCKFVDLTDNRGITDLSFVKSMPNLKEIRLENDELITDFKPLIDRKIQFDRIILPEQASDKVRKDLINKEELSLMKDDMVVEAVKPSGILKETDKVSVEDPTIAQAKIVAPEEDDNLEADSTVNPYLQVKGKKVGITTMTIKMGSETKTIKVNVIDPESLKASFDQTSTTMKLGTFKKYKFENVESSDIQSVKFTCDGNAVEMIDNKDGTYTPVAKNEGTSKVSAQITLKDGNVKEVKEATFTVTKADDNTVVIKDYDLYKGMMNNGKSADTDQNGMISKDEIKNVDEIVVQNSKITDLTGIEEAINCKKVDFTNDGQLKDIKALEKLTNLTNVILKSTAVSDISVLKNLPNLKDVELRDSNVSEKEQLALLKLNDTSMTEGESRTQEITPSGIVGDTTKVDVADANVATAQIRNGSLIITGKAAGTTTVSIYNNDKESAITIKVNVEKKQEPTTEEPSKPQEPTTEKPQQPTKPKPQVVKVSKITLSAPVTNVAPGKKVKIKATITPTKAANKAVTWSTSDKKLATVDKNGTVTFNKKAGGKSVTITATAKDGSKKKASIKFKVAKGEVKKITITGKKTLNVGKTLTLKAKVTATKGANKKLKWTSSNTKYATVSSSGKVKALKAGKKKTVTITAAATDGTGKKATIKIKIK